MKNMFLLLIFAIIVGGALAGCAEQQALPTLIPTSTLKPTSLPTETLPAPTATESPIVEPELPSPTATHTVIVPTATQIPPTATIVIPTFTPRPTSTPLPTATPTPIRKTVELSCKAGEAFSVCSDPVLGISFEIPKSWGAWQGYLTNEGAPGLKYDYLLDSFNKKRDYKIVAGGRSATFTTTQTPVLTDFRGYINGKPWTCDEHALCIEMQPNVYMIYAFPKAEVVCNPKLPALIYKPMVIVEVNQRAQPYINGFLFGSEYLTQGEIDELMGPIWGIKTPRTCTATEIKDYYARVADFRQRIENQTISSEALDNAKVMRRIARTLTFFKTTWKP